MKDRTDVCLLHEMKPGHKDNSQEVHGIQEMSQFRAVRRTTEGGKRVIYIREISCFCKFCALSLYDKCVITSVWTKIDVKVDPSKDVVIHDWIAEFYILP